MENQGRRLTSALVRFTQYRTYASCAAGEEMLQGQPQPCGDAGSSDGHAPVASTTRTPCWCAWQSSSSVTGLKAPSVVIVVQLKPCHGPPTQKAKTSRAGGGVLSGSRQLREAEAVDALAASSTDTTRTCTADRSFILLPGHAESH